MVLGLLLLVASLLLLVFASWPVERVTQSEPLNPTDLTLPTPESFLVPALPTHVEAFSARWL
jgi:hypothetical protein